MCNVAAGCCNVNLQIMLTGSGDGARPCCCHAAAAWLFGCCRAVATSCHAVAMPWPLAMMYAVVLSHVDCYHAGNKDNGQSLINTTATAANGQWPMAIIESSTLMMCFPKSSQSQRLRQRQELNANAGRVYVYPDVYAYANYKLHTASLTLHSGAMRAMH